MIVYHTVLSNHVKFFYVSPFPQILLWCTGSFEGDGITMYILSIVNKRGAFPSIYVRILWASIKFHCF